MGLWYTYGKNRSETHLSFRSVSSAKSDATKVQKSEDLAPNAAGRLRFETYFLLCSLYPTVSALTALRRLLCHPIYATHQSLKAHLRFGRMATPAQEQNQEQQEQLVVPEGYTLHSENSAHILLPADNGAFLNPVQEFNRDLSVACIRTWGDLMNEQRKAKREKELERKAQGGGKKAKKAKGACCVSLEAEAGRSVTC